jgi:hypothetical protein
MKMPKPTMINKAASVNRCNQKKQARQKPSTPRTSTLEMTEAEVAKTKYSVNATTAIKTMKPYGIKVKQRVCEKVAA